MPEASISRQMDGFKMLKKIFRYALNKPLYMKYYKPLDPPTLREQQLIADLIKTFQELSYEDTADCFRSEIIWKLNLNILRELVLTDNPREFLRWDVIMGTMFVSNDKYVTTELNHLRGKPDWNERWQKAIEEVAPGRPVPFNKYHRSSGNLIHHAYHLSQFEEKTGVALDDVDFVFEFGGGYGSMCRLFYNLGFKGKYVIFDLPHFAALQKYYLKTIGITVHALDKFKSAENGVVCISDIEKLQNILSGHNDSCHSLFIATWSISEAPLHIRDAVLSLASSFSSFLISYQVDFGEMDNIKYFETYKNYCQQEIQWNQWQIKHLPKNTYLVGTRNSPVLPIYKQPKARHLTIEEAIQCNFFYRIIQHYWHKKKHRQWRRLRKPIPTPHLVKQMAVKTYAAEYETDVFIETGTYLGEMVCAVKYSFIKIYSIELGSELYKRAEKKFSKHKHIAIYNGDSSIVLPEILKRINEPCLFWLDAHYSAGITDKGEKETPIMKELESIFSHPIEGHVILIDDARCFTGQNDYPALEELKELIINRYPNYVFTVKDDIIRAHKNIKTS
ncbi:hypothetical protein ACFL3R_00410 [Thermodesulfobacteriota bacterium]